MLHSPDFIPPLYVRRFRCVITIHDLHFLIYPKFLTEESARYYGQIDRAVQRADHIIVPSEATRQDTIKLLGVPESRISVISEAANPLFRPLERSQALAQARIYEFCFVALPLKIRGATGSMIDPVAVV